MPTIETFPTPSRLISFAGTRPWLGCCSARNCSRNRHDRVHISGSRSDSKGAGFMACRILLAYAPLSAIRERTTRSHLVVTQGL